MSLILQTIKEKFGYYNSFTPRELSVILNKNQKVVSMVLKKYSNSEVLGHLRQIDKFYLREEEDVLNCKKKANDLIEKYDLKQKKHKI